MEADLQSDDVSAVRDYSASFPREAQGRFLLDKDDKEGYTRREEQEYSDVFILSLSKNEWARLGVESRKLTPGTGYRLLKK